jgi:hypothetical protein
MLEKNTLEKRKLFEIKEFVHDPNDTEHTDKVAQAMHQIDEERFSARDVFFTPEYFKRMLINTIPNEENKGRVNVVILIENSKDHSIFGFIYAEPATSIYNDREEMRFHPERLQDENIEETAYISDAVFKRSGMGGGFSSLDDVLESKLKEKGYKFIDLDATLDHRLAENIRKKYSKKILKEEGHDSPTYGKQVFFKLRI